ncbi:MAG TPA: TonB-dependent receptor [Allosphingosinicella sp.]|nr:TonB-dependent receptor [Allosphingosinicella sp.]
MPFLLPLLFAAQATPDIVVTGRGLAPAAGEEVFDTIVVDRDRLTGSASGRLEEVLRDVPGFQLFRRSDSRSANPTSQGATLRALGGNASSRVLLVLDGVPQTDPFGGWVSWPAYHPERLGEARVTRGGGSGVQGPGALAGTIELSSATPAQLRGPRGRLAYGSRDGLDAFAGLGLPLGGGFVAVSGAWQRGDGFIPIVPEQRGAADRPSPYEQMSLAVRGVAPLRGGAELQASGLVFSDTRERGTAFSVIRTRGADASIRLVGRRWSALGYVQTRDFYNSFASVPQGRATASRTSEQFSVPATGLGARVEARPKIGSRVELRLGGDWRLTEGETRELYAFAAGAGTRGRVAGGRSGTLGGFAEGAWTSDSVTVTLGGRIDRWSISNGRLNERVLATGAVLTDAAFRNRSGREPTGRAGIAWRAVDEVTLRGAAYLGWRLPTLNELYRPFRVGTDATAANAELEPERLQGAEAGVDLRPTPRVRIGFTAFTNRLEGAIANVTLGRGPGTFPGVGFVAAGGDYRRRGNLDSIEARGIELEGHLALGAWSLSGGWSWVDAEVEASGPALALDGLRPAQTPRHGLSSTFAWNKRGAAASLTARYSGSQYEDDLNRQLLPGAFTLDAVGRIPIGRGLAIEARAENVANARILAGISGEGIEERASPRTFWIGLRFGGLR